MTLISSTNLKCHFISTSIFETTSSKEKQKGFLDANSKQFTVAGGFFGLNLFFLYYGSMIILFGIKVLITC